MKCRHRFEPVGSIHDSGCLAMTTFANSPSPASSRTPLGLHRCQPQPRLYDRLIEVLRTADYSRRTEEAYVLRPMLTSARPRDVAIPQSALEQARLTDTLADLPK